MSFALRVRRSRTSRRAAAAFAAVAATVALSGCGSDIHPGVAATINGNAIQQSTVDDTTSAFCRLNEKGSQPTVVSRAYLRTFIARNFVQFQLTSDAAKELGLTVTDASVDASSGTYNIPSSLSASDTELLTDLYENYARSQIERALIGAHLDDPSVTTSDQLKAPTKKQAALADDYMAKFSAEQDVTLNPMYGTWTGTDVQPSSGSMSLASSALADDLLKASTQSDADKTVLPGILTCG